MAARGRLSLICISTAQSLDQRKMFTNGIFVSFALVGFVPLKVVVEHERNDFLKLFDETVCDHTVDDSVELFIER